MAVVHLSCLQSWRLVARRGRNPAACGGRNCETCLGEYLPSIVYTGGTVDPRDGRWETKALGEGWTPEEARHNNNAGDNNNNNNNNEGMGNNAAGANANPDRDWDHPNLRDVLDLAPFGRNARLAALRIEFVSAVHRLIARISGQRPPPPQNPADPPPRRAPQWLALFPPHVAAALRSPPPLWRLLAKVLTSPPPGRQLAVLLLPPLLSLYCTARRFLKKRGVSRRRWSCTLCARRARWKCVRCLRSYYCSRDCQNADWHLLHRHLCFRPRKAAESSALYASAGLALSLARPGASALKKAIRFGALSYSFYPSLSSSSIVDVLSFIMSLLLSHTAPLIVTFVVILPLSFVCCGIIVGEVANGVKSLKIPVDFGFGTRRNGGAQGDENHLAAPLDVLLADIRDVLRRYYNRPGAGGNYELRDPTAPAAAAEPRPLDNNNNDNNNDNNNVADAAQELQEADLPPLPPRLARDLQEQQAVAPAPQPEAGTGAAAGPALPLPLPVVVAPVAAVLRRPPRRVALVAVEGAEADAAAVAAAAAAAAVAAAAALDPNFDDAPEPPAFRREDGQFVQDDAARHADEHRREGLAARLANIRAALPNVAAAANNRRTVDIRGRSLEVFVLLLAGLATIIGSSIVFNSFGAYSDYLFAVPAQCGTGEGPLKMCLAADTDAEGKCFGLETHVVRLVRFAASRVASFREAAAAEEALFGLPAEALGASSSSAIPLRAGASVKCMNDLINFGSIILAAVFVLLGQFIHDAAAGGGVRAVRDV